MDSMDVQKICKTLLKPSIINVLKMKVELEVLEEIEDNEPRSEVLLQKACNLLAI